MRFEFDKKSGAGLALVAIAFFGLGLAINTQRDGDSSGHSGMHSSDSSKSEYSGDDIMFAQMMIPHHQQAIEISDLALKNSKNPQVLKLAEEIKAAQAPEISQMKSWLTSAGQSLMGDHGMSMDGMLSDDEIVQLRQATGIAFDKLFLAGMIAHHEGALSMVSMIEDSKNEEAKTLAQNIKVSQSAEIDLMKRYLAELK